MVRIYNGIKLYSMKKLTKEEAEKIMLKGSGRSSPVMSMLQGMKAGEILFVERIDWNWKRGPGILCKRLENTRGMKFTCKKALDGSGWVIERVG